MLTFGKRLKEYRKKAEFTQAELAEKMGVSIQTLSRWETDTGMPDIIQIVPLSKILDVSLDALLGVVSDEQAEIDRFFSMERSIRKKKINNQKIGERNCDRWKEIYETLRETVHRFPYNYEVSLRCGHAGVNYYKSAVFQNCFDLSEKEQKEIYKDIEKMLMNIISHDNSVGRIVSAKKHLIRMYCISGYYSKAELEAETLDYYEGLWAQYEVAHCKYDYSEMQRISKKRLFITMLDYLWNVFFVANDYSITGAEKRAEAIVVWEKLIENCKLLHGTMANEPLCNVESQTVIRLAKDHLRNGDYDKCLDCAEYLVELFEENYDFYKKLKAGDESVYDNIFTETDPAYKDDMVAMDLDDLKRSYKMLLCDCWNDFADKENNPVVTNARYKVLVEKIENLA